MSRKKQSANIASPRADGAHCGNRQGSDRAGYPDQRQRDAAAHEPARRLRLSRLRMAGSRKHTSTFEFCENGAKAVAWEATAKRVTPEFFADHTVTELAGLERLPSGDEGRLTHPMAYDAETDTIVPIEWDDAFALIGAAPAQPCRDPMGGFLYLGSRLQRSRLPLPALRARIRHQQLPRLLQHVPRGNQRRPAANPSASAKARSCWRISTTPKRSSSSARTRAPTAPG